MTFLEFFAKYNGKLVDLDNYPKGQVWQCVDLVRLFCIEALGLPRNTLAPGNAKDIYLRYPIGLTQMRYQDSPLASQIR